MWTQVYVTRYDDMTENNKKMNATIIIIIKRIRINI